MPQVSYFVIIRPCLGLKILRFFLTVSKLEKLNKKLMSKNYFSKTTSLNKIRNRTYFQGHTQDDSSVGLDLRSSIRPRDTLSKLQLNAGQFPDNGACDWVKDDDRNVLDQSYAVQLANQKLHKECGAY